MFQYLWIPNNNFFNSTKKSITFQRKMRMPQLGVDLIEIILMMNCYNAFTLLWKKRIQTLWLAKPKNSSWDLLKSWKLAQRKLPLLILLKSLKCKCIQVFSWNQFHENFRKNGSQLPIYFLTNFQAPSTTKTFIGFSICWIGNHRSSWW